MAPDDVFKKYQEAGADFLEEARTRAEEFLRELAKASGATQKQAQDTFDELVEGSRKGTEQVVSWIRTEITSQLAQLGLATKEDLESLEGRLSGGTRRTATSTPAPAKKATTRRTTTKSAASAASAGTAATATKKAAAKKAAAKKATPAKVTPRKATATKKAPGRP